VGDLRRAGTWLFDLKLDLHSALVVAAICLLLWLATRSFPRRRVVRFVSSASFEVSLVCALFALWQLANRVTRGHIGGGLARGRALWHAERVVGVPSERLLQQLILPHHWLVRLTNDYYDYAHLTGMFVFLVWFWLAHRDRYPRWRNTLALFTAMSLLVQMVSFAPPRLIGHTGLIDTAAVYGQSVYSVIGSGIADQYAAMPSIHVGWALLISFAVVTSSTTRFRWVFALHGPITIFVVVATANHYWFDAVGAALLLELAWLGSAALERWRAPAAQPVALPQIQQGAFS
jgi:hypothetical protein